jgi:hypothetical protein
MSEDTISLLIYLALGLVGVIASAYKNKMKKQQQNASRPRTSQSAPSYPSAPAKEYEPDLGSLMELFEINKPRQEPIEEEYESVESGASLEEAGMTVESREGSAELAGMQMDSNISSVDKQISEIESFEEGQSDIQKMIAKYDAIRKDIEDDELGDDIAKGEIVSVEAEEAARIKKAEGTEYFNLRKAIIYSEILKRKEY